MITLRKNQVEPISKEPGVFQGETPGSFADRITHCLGKVNPYRFRGK